MYKSIGDAFGCLTIILIIILTLFIPLGIWKIIDIIIWIFK